MSKKDKPENTLLVEGKKTLLYVKHVETKYEEDDDKVITKINSHNIFSLYINHIYESVDKVSAIIHELNSADDGGILEIYISSGGGYVHQGVDYLNVIENKFPGKSITEITSKAYSMGAILFMSGAQRIVNSRSDMMIHNYSGGTSGRGGEMLDFVEHQNEMFDGLLSRYFLAHNFITKKEMNDIRIGKELWINSHQMLERGIATHIALYGTLYTADEYLSGAVKKEFNKFNKLVEPKDKANMKYMPNYFTKRIPVKSR